MTMVACGKRFVPNLIAAGGVQSITAAVNLPAFDSVNDRMAWVGPCPVTDTLSKVYMRMATVTTGCTVKVEIQSVTNGRPSGAILAAGANGTVTIADTDDNIWKSVTIGTPPSVTEGQDIAIVLTYDSGAIPNMQFVAMSTPLAASATMSPAFFIDTGAGTWASAVGVSSSIGYGPVEWVVEFGTAGPQFMACLMPLNSAPTLNAITSASTPDEYALRFQLPYKCRIRGIRWVMANAAAGSNYTASLWDASGVTDAAALAQFSGDGDNATSTTNDGYVDAIFATPYTIDKNTTYYAGIRSDNANAITVITMSAAGTGAAASGVLAFDSTMTIEMYLASRTWTAGTAGAWATTTTAIPLIHLIIDQIDDGDGTGGGTVTRQPTVSDMISGSVSRDLILVNGVPL